MRLIDELEIYAKHAMPNYPNDVCSRAKAEIERLQEAKRAALKVADERSKENCALMAHCAALVEIVCASPCPYNGRATGVTVGECQQCGCSSGLMIKPRGVEQEGDGNG